MNPPPQRKVNVEMPANLNGVYANAAVISHTTSELIMDFIQIIPNDPRARVQSRVILTPANAKMFLQALQTSLDNFEKLNGQINLPPQPPSLVDQFFKSLSPKPDEPAKEDKGDEPHG